MCTTSCLVALLTKAVNLVKGTKIILGIKDFAVKGFSWIQTQFQASANKTKAEVAEGKNKTLESTIEIHKRALSNRRATENNLHQLPEDIDQILFKLIENDRLFHINDICNIANSNKTTAIYHRDILLKNNYIEECRHSIQSHRDIVASKTTPTLYKVTSLGVHYQRSKANI